MTDAKPLEIRVPGAPDFSPHFKELLETARVESTLATRSSLDSSLQEAWGAFHFERKQQTRQASPELLAQLKDSIRKTKALLGRLERCQEWREVGCDFCPVDDATISIAKVPETLELPRNPPALGRLPDLIPPHGIRAAINRKRMLDRLVREIDHFSTKRKRGNQKKLDKAIIVAHAASFFRQFSTVKPTTYWDGPFAKFCKKFYVAVTGEMLTGSGLDKAIRNEVKEPTSKPK
jgi:hypothetical protein